MGTFYDWNFLAHAVTFEDSMTGNVLAEDLADTTSNHVLQNTD